MAKRTVYLPRELDEWVEQQMADGTLNLSRVCRQGLLEERKRIRAGQARPGRRGSVPQ